MFNLLKVFTKVYISSFNWRFIPFAKVLFHSNEDLDKVIRTHGGYAVFTKKYVYKITYNKNTKHLYSNQINFSHKANSLFLIPSKLIYSSERMLVTREYRISNISLFRYEIFDVIKPYGLLIGKTIRIEKAIDAEKFIHSNFNLIKNNTYKRTIKILLNKMHKNIQLGLTHGDFWHGNLIESDARIFFIDFDRSNEYSFIEFDLINYFVFYIVYKDEKPSWNIFIRTMTNLLHQDCLFFELKEFISVFFLSNNKINVNDTFLDEIIRLYILKVLYTNDSFLEGVTYLKWYRHKKKIEQLLWN